MKRLSFLIFSFLLASICVLGQTLPQEKHTMDYAGHWILAIYKDAFKIPKLAYRRYFTKELFELYNMIHTAKSDGSKDTICKVTIIN